MRRIFLFLLLAGILLNGCGLASERIKEPVHFYYIRSEYHYASAEAVIVSEEREASGHRDNPAYLLALYKMGPSDDNLQLPFPPNTSLSYRETRERGIEVVLGTNSETFTDAQFSLASACLALTCFDLTEADRIAVSDNARSITVTRDDFILVDDSMTVQTEDVQ